MTTAAHAPGVQARVHAAQIIEAVHRGRSLRAELTTVLPMLPDVRDRALVEAICFAAIRHAARCDAALDAWTPRKLGARDAPLRALLHAGLVQLHVLGLPAHAAVAATVDACRAIGRAHQAGMVNALLRRAGRDGLPADDPASRWPQWLRDELRAAWPDDADGVFAASGSAAPLWLRVNRTQQSREVYSARLAAAGIAHALDTTRMDALRLDTPVPVNALPGFADGAASVQDGAAQQVADALVPASNARVLDACAAPGGKGAHLLERDPSVRLTALDIDASRLRTVRATFERLRIGRDARLLANDATQTAAWWDGQPFDGVLLDAPCSATGIVRRQPDVLLHRQPADIDALVQLQARLLDALWSTLKPGGIFVYATCSILPRENAAQVDAFLASTPDARAEALDAEFGRESGAGRQRLTGEDGCDGFFFARLRKAEMAS